MRVLILEDDHEIYAGLLREALPSLIASQSVEEVGPSARSCDIWFGQPDLLFRLLRAVPPPKWIQSTWAGFERFQAPDLPRGYLLTRAVGVFGQSMAEYVLSYMLARERQHASRRGAQENGIWDTRFQHFKPRATFINAGRGSAVVEEDLVAAMKSGLVSWAVLDVCRQEPLDPGSPLWGLEGVFLTGHTAAPSIPASLVRLFRSNLERFRAGEALEGVVDLSLAGSGS